MAKIKPTVPSQIYVDDYTKYRPWLLSNFYDQICLYCLINHRAVEIDHYKPSSAFPAFKHDYKNLLLSCSTCNKNKGDYHPQNKNRNRAKKNHSGFYVINVLNSDIVKILDMKKNGEMQPVPGSQEFVGRNNIDLLGLNVDFLVKARRHFIDMLRMAEYLESISSKDATARYALQTLVDNISRSELFYKIMDIKIDSKILKYLDPKTYRCSAK